jgi:hypothetical protein
MGAVNSTSLSAFTYKAQLLQTGRKALKLRKDMLLTYTYMASVHAISLAWTNPAQTGVTTR